MSVKVDGNLAVKLVPEAEPLVHEVTEIASQARQIVITNAGQYQAASGELMRIKGVMKRIDEVFDPIVKKAHEAHKAAVAAKKSLTDQFVDAEKSIKRAMIAYDEEQERKAKELQEKLRKEAEAKAAEKKQELIDQADLAIELGADDEAEELLNQADSVQVLTPLVSSNTVSVGGIAKKKTWKARVTNPKLVPAYFGEFEIRKINEGQLNRIAQMTGGAAKIPGVEFYEERGISARSV